MTVTAITGCALSAKVSALLAASPARATTSVPGFDYSPALEHSGVRWTAANLNRWLTDPEAFIPGQKMGYQVTDPVDRRDIVAFLASPAAR